MRSIEEFEAQLDEGAFIMDHNEAARLGLYPSRSHEAIRDYGNRGKA